MTAENGIAEAFKSPVRYYCYLRRMGYQPRTARICTLDVFCHTREERDARLRKYNRVAR